MNIAWFEDIGKDDGSTAGGKGANLGELIRAGLQVPEGYVVTAGAYQKFMEESGLADRIMEILSMTDVDDNDELTEASEKIRSLIHEVNVPEDLKKDIVEGYKKLSGDHEATVAVRSSATAEDLPGASFAGQQDTFLNIRGGEEVVFHVRKCWSSLFTPRAIFYRDKKDFDHRKVRIAVVVQKMVNAEKAGVMFSVHPATGENDRMVVEAAWGLGEGVVSGSVTPDHYVIDKGSYKALLAEVAQKDTMFVRDEESGETVKREVPEDQAKARVLSEEELREIGQLGKKVEEHYGSPQDMEWAIEGGKLYLLQSRPVTVLYEKEKTEGEEQEEENREILVKGLGAAPGIGTGRAKVIMSLKELDKVKEGNILVTSMTNPDMVPAMRRASAIVTDEGGMTCHAAIVSRELGIPCVVGTGDASKKLGDNIEITVDGHRGMVYKGIAEKEEREEAPQVAQPKVITATEVKANISIPEVAPRVAPLADGVGLLRVEHMILGIGQHPIKFIKDGEEEKLVGKIASGVRKVASAFYPKPVWYRSLDAPTDEFRSLRGGGG